MAIYRHKDIHCGHITPELPTFSCFVLQVIFLKDISLFVLQDISLCFVLKDISLFVLKDISLCFVLQVISLCFVL